MDGLSRATVDFVAGPQSADGFNVLPEENDLSKVFVLVSVGNRSVDRGLDKLLYSHLDAIGNLSD